MRALVGVRLGAFGVGLNAASVGAVLAVGYLSLRFPDARAAANDAELNPVVYDVPHWMLDVGAGLLCVGLLCLLVGWYSSPGWQQGALHRWWGRTLASALISGWLTAVLVAVLGRESAEIRLWLVLVVALPALTVVTLLGMWRRAGR